MRYEKKNTLYFYVGVILPKTQKHIFSVVIQIVRI